MPACRFSRLARLDLIEIGDYTLDHWGEDQAIRYLDSLGACFDLIAANPEVGRRCDRLRKGYRRMEHDKHVVFYKIETKSVLVVRVLHQRTLPESRAMDEQE
jgi:toxin ParE1/3/4